MQLARAYSTYCVSHHVDVLRYMLSVMFSQVLRIVAEELSAHMLDHYQHTHTHTSHHIGSAAMSLQSYYAERLKSSIPSRSKCPMKSGAGPLSALTKAVR